MIKVKVLNDKITMSGHAMYDDYGKDIVCSSASSIVITTVNAILSFGEYINYEEKKDLFIINILEHNDVSDKLIKNMINMLEELQDDYPKNINIRKEYL